jgi:hypothetical protein
LPLSPFRGSEERFAASIVVAGGLKKACEEGAGMKDWAFGGRGIKNKQLSRVCVV